MKKKLLSLLLLFFSLSPVSFAGGGITHMFIAAEAISLLPDPELRNILLNNLDAYLVGSYYPDSGYVNGTHYGEDSHWDPFIYSFADHLKHKYTNPATENPRLVAFMFGCAVHRVSDEVIHWTFYPVIQYKDFKGDGDAAHSNGDIGIDLLAVIDKPKSLLQPNIWWVPIADLLEIYQRMGLPQYTSAEIIYGNAVISVAGYGERIAAPAAYPILKWKMPWTAGHYYTWPEGGITMDERKVADYQVKLWQYLKNKSAIRQTTTATHASKPISRPALEFGDAALEEGVVTINAQFSPDGSIEMNKPIIQDHERFNMLIDDLLRKLKN